MAKIITEIEFPCGYKFKRFIKTSWTEEIETSDLDYLRECPLHGDKCKKFKT